MTLLRFRELALKRSALGRTVLLLALVGGVLVGLLAMHTISSASGEQMTTASTMSADMSHSHSDGGMVSPGQIAMPTDCGGMCEPGHIMTGMACVLALLFSSLVLAIAASRRSASFGAASRDLWLTIVAVAETAIPPPPDLNALSISRT